MQSDLYRTMCSPTPMVNYLLVFDDVMIKQLHKAAKNQQLKEILKSAYSTSVFTSGLQTIIHALE